MRKILVRPMNMRSASTASVRPSNLLGLTRHQVSTFAIASLLLCFTSCGEQSQELDERVTQLQKELDKTQTDLQAANKSLGAAKEELARLKKNGATAPANAAVPVASTSALPPSRNALEQSYTASAKELKQQVQAKLKGFSLDSCTLHNIEMQSQEYPVASKISFSVRAGNGTQFQLDLPAKADRSGKWVFPDVADIVQHIEELGRSSAQTASAVESSPPPSRRASVEQRSASGATGLPANRTVVIQWPNSGSTSVPQSQPNPPSAPETSTRTAPQSGASNTNGLPANRTVVIQWPDDGSSSAATNQPKPPNRTSVPATAPAKKVPADQDVLTQF